MISPAHKGNPQAASAWLTAWANGRSRPRAPSADPPGGTMKMIPLSWSVLIVCS
jgi:hypothetical protein